MVGPIGVVGGSPSSPSQNQPLGVFTPAPNQQIASPQCPSPPQSQPIGVVSFPEVQVNPNPPGTELPGGCIECPTGPPGPVGPPGPAGPDIDLYAATRIVSIDPNHGTDTTIQAAVDALPPEGGLIFLREGTYVQSASVVLPVAKKVVIRGCGQATVIDLGSNPIPAFTIQNGLTDFTQYVFSNFTVPGSGAVGQEFIRCEDATGMATIYVDQVYVEDVALPFNFTAYDVTFSIPTKLYVSNSRIIPPAANAELVRTPNPAGTYAGAVLVYFTNCYMQDDATGNPWFMSLDGDFFAKECRATFSVGSGSGAFQWLGGAFSLSNGDFTINGGNWFASSSIERCGITGPGGNSRLIMVESAGSVSKCFISAMAIQLAGPGSGVYGCYISKGTPALANPAVEMVATAIGAFVSWGWFALFANGCVKITNATGIKVHDNNFDTTVTGQTVFETGTSDKNCIHDNTGFASGTGNTVNINGNDQVHNNIN